MSLRVKLKVQELARTRGLSSSTQLQRACNLSSPATAAKLWYERLELIGFETLQSLCDGLACVPGDLFEFTPRKTRASGTNKKAAPLAKPQGKKQAVKKPVKAKKAGKGGADRRKKTRAR